MSYSPAASVTTTPVASSPVNPYGSASAVTTTAVASSPVNPYSVASRLTTAAELGNPSWAASVRIPSSDYEALILADSPLIYWRLGELEGTVAQDVTTNNRDGTYIGVPTLGIASLIPNELDKSALFDGNDDRVHIPLSSAIALTTGVTVEMWVDIPDALRKGAFLKVGDADDGWGIGIGADTFDANGNELIFLREAVAWNGANVNAGTGKKHIVFTLSGGTVTWYVNGAQVASYATGSINAPQSDFNVGGYGAAGGRYFSGGIDEFAFYGTILTATRIGEHYTAGTGAAVPTDVSTTEVTSESVTLNWMDNATDETGYQVMRSDGGGSFTDVSGTLPANTVTYEDTSVSTGSTVIYEVRAVKTGAPSAKSTRMIVVIPSTNRKLWNKRLRRTPNRLNKI